MYCGALNLWTKVTLKINQHIQACQIPLTPQHEFIMQKWLQYVKFTGLDTECSLLSKCSPVFRDVSLTKQWGRTESEPAQTSLWFIPQELFQGGCWGVREFWWGPGQTMDGTGHSQSIPIPGLLPKDSPPSLSPGCTGHTSWSQLSCSASSTLMVSLNALSVTQKSTEKSEIHGREASFKKGSSSYVTSVWKGSYFPDLAFAITKSFTFQP